MTDNLPADAVPDDTAAIIEAVPFSVGAALREARIHHGLSVDEISNRIKFAPRQIEALEADDFAHLPEIAFVRGFVRSYARLVQLDDMALLAALPHSPEQSVSLESKALTEVPYPDIYTERKQNIIWLSAALSVAVLLGLSAWLLGDKPKETNAQTPAVTGAQNVTVESLPLPAVQPVSAVSDQEHVTAAPGIEKPVLEKPDAEKPGIEKLSAEKSGAEKAAAEKTGAEKKAAEVKNMPQVISPPVQTTAVPSASQPVKPVAANNASGQAVIRITFDADSWVGITDKDGKHLLSQLNHAGSEQNINGSPPFSLTIGYAKAVHLYYKGKAVDLAPYADEEVVHLTLE
jgi:cytoskeleton protein RodZ